MNNWSYIFTFKNFGDKNTQSDNSLNFCCGLTLWPDVVARCCGSMPQADAAAQRHGLTSWPNADA
jgi:hypothetical protein